MNKPKSRILARVFLLSFILSWLLCSCGQTGPLYLPTPSDENEADD